MARTAELFRTVPAQHHLGFWANQTLDAKKVAEFYEFDKREVAKVADVAPSSVRYDQKIHMRPINEQTILQGLKEVWQTDPALVEKAEGGFDWWPGDHKVRVKCHRNLQKGQVSSLMAQPQLV